MSDPLKLKVRIISPDQVIFEGEAEHVLAPSVHGMLGFLPTHTPLFAELIKGEILIKGEKEELVAIESGIAKVQNDELTLLVVVG